MRLTTKDHWEKVWTAKEITAIEFDPLLPNFRERHQLFEKYIPKSTNGTVMEIGAYPGRYLHYFHKYFQYMPWGVEYVETNALHAVRLLENNGVFATILNKDFFTLDPQESPTGDGWNITMSFGFIEHFDDSTEVITKHIEVTRAGGIIILSVPNHAGINGWILHKIDKELWDQHNKMSLKDMQIAVKKAGGSEVLYAGYVGHLGFGPSNLWPAVRERFGAAYPLIRAPVWVIERLAQWIVPNNRWTSPDTIMILSKEKSSTTKVVNDVEEK